MLKIDVSVDGIYISTVTKEKVLEDLRTGELRIESIKAEVPEGSDPNYWGEGIWLFENDTPVVPRPVTKVTDFSF